MSKHTPGPWTYYWYEKNQRTHVGEFGITEETRGYSFPLTMGGKRDSGYAKTAEANARLIAAAPDLLEAARIAANACDILATESADSDDTEHAEIWRRKAARARAAIAKATGEA